MQLATTNSKLEDMAALYNPKTLAKTLTYLLIHAPGEYGLFWDEDGSMPWKELYWALQEDPGLRFVRESHLREIGFLGIDFPAVLDGHLLRLKPSSPVPEYPVVDAPPSRLFYGCRQRHVLAVRVHGLTAAGRPALAVSSDKDLALRIARRRDPAPILIDILADAAAAEGARFRFAGGDLYLVESLPIRHLRLPLMSEEKLQGFASRSRKMKEPAKPGAPRIPGSFVAEVEHLRDAFGVPPDTGGKPKSKGRKGAEWKRASRKERNKRSL
jgi:putative RNA 2'-phosphotransferase